jgi:hypothetical protein
LASARTVDAATDEVTAMAHVPKHSRPAGTPFALERDRAAIIRSAVPSEGPGAGSQTAPSPEAPRTDAGSAVRRTDAGIAVLAVRAPERPTGPVTHATWAKTVRRFARALVWTLPLSAVVSGLSTVGAIGDGGPKPLLDGERPLRLVAWFAGVWLAMLAMVALVGLLAAARGRVTAVTGLMVGLFGAVPMLTFAALPRDTVVFGARAWVVALGAAVLYSLGWLLVGSAVLRSRLFTRGDGLLLMIASPLVGLGGLVLAPLHTLGALFMLAGGIGVAWMSGRLLPAASRTRIRPARPSRPRGRAVRRAGRARTTTPVAVIPPAGVAVTG